MLIGDIGRELPIGEWDRHGLAIRVADIEKQVQPAVSLVE